MSRRATVTAAALPVTWVALGLAAAPSRSQSPDDGFRRIDTGLNYRVTVHRALGFVRGIEQTDDGYLWFATSAGLVRYDGLAFAYFDSGNTPELTEDRLADLVRTPDDALWLLTERGQLVQRSRGHWQRHVFPVPLGNDLACCLTHDATGALVVGTEAHGLYTYRSGDWAGPLGGPDGTPAGIEQLHRNARGEVLARAEGRWWRLEDGGLRALAGASVAGRTSVEVLLDFYLPPGGPGAAHPMFDPVRQRGAQRVRLARDGGVWLGSPGLAHVTAAGAREYGYADGLASLNVQTVFEDRDGNLWVGHFGTGLTQMTRTPFYPLGPSRGLAGGAAFSIVELDTGELWLSGSGFFTLFKDGRMRNVVPGPELPLWGARSLAAGRDGWVWANAVHPRLYQLRIGAHRVHPFPDPAPGEFSTAIGLDGEGTPWAASSHGGLLTLRDGRLARVPLPELGGFGCAERITQDYPCRHAVNVLRPRRAGGLWLGTHGRGLWRRDPGGATIRVPAPAPDDAVVFALHEDADGDLWVGSDAGLLRLPAHPDSARPPARFTRQDGLISDGIFEIVEDGLGQLWLGSERGIFHLRKDALHARAAGGRALLDPVSYRAIDGLPSDEVIRRFEPHGLRDREGRLWFCTVAGLAIFDPPETEPPRAAPRALLERVVLKGMRFEEPWPEAPPRIPPGEGDLQFHYTAPAFAGAHRVRFRYQLQGFDRAIVEAGARRAAFYTNLPPGDYVFEVQAHMAEAGTAAEAARFAFTLRPHLHQTAPFYVALALVLLAVALAAQRLRIRQVQARYRAVEAERDRIARDLHDTLAQVFSAMGFHLDSIASLVDGAAPELVRERLRRVKQMLGHGRLAARNVILNLRAERGTGPPGRALQTLLEAIPPVYDADAAQIAVSISGAPRALPAAVENDLFGIAQEAVSNAIEHGKAQLVSIELEYLPDRVALMIHDDGTGFAEAPPAADAIPRTDETGIRFGLRGMRERAARIGATFEVLTEPGVGTEISVVLPVPASPAPSPPSDPS